MLLLLEIIEKKWVFYCSRIRRWIYFSIYFKYHDYIVYDVNNCYYLDPKYNDTIKIANYTENKIPDFFHADYAMVFDNLDRYFRRTTLIAIFARRYLNVKNKDFMRKRNQTLNNKIRKKFCAAVITNNLSTDWYRLHFIQELNK